ncbi:MAG TPA: hypothetical protein QGF58_25175 [Myxococcota bacterium]|nr:hypothetical protein [Myxococcota bacterium]
MSRSETYKLVDAACDFWFNDNARVTSPFPKDIQVQLKRNAQDEYVKWLENLEPSDHREVDDEELAGVFEQLLFGEALKLVGEDDKELLMTIHYPFMPRVGDKVDDRAHGASEVVGRELKETEDGKLHMVVSLRATEDGEPWQTEFAIPA